MQLRHKQDRSISLLRATLGALVIGIPVALVQLSLFSALHGGVTLRFSAGGLLNALVFIAVLLVSIGLHEFIHGLTWKVFANKPSTTVSYGVQWQSLTPYAHVSEPLEITVYRIGGFMPGLVLGILPYLLSLLLGNPTLLLFGLIHTFAAGGDWLILWSLRTLKPGTLVEDHPTRAGCYALEA